METTLGNRPVVVPLDGSELAERTLPYAQALARATNSRLLLLSVVEPPKSAGSGHRDVGDDAIQRASAHFATYLQALKARLDDDTEICVDVREDDLSESILRSIDESAAQYVAISTHGRSGIDRWRHGSTVHRLLHDSSVPMLVAGPRVLERRECLVVYRHILVPLDARPLSEAAIPYAEHLAHASGARISLAQVVGWPAETYPYVLPDAYVPQLDSNWTAAAESYLSRREKDLGRLSVRASVLRGSTVKALMSFVEREAVDLVVMATHARTGFSRAILGSVADRMLQARAPVLLVRPKA